MYIVRIARNKRQMWFALRFPFFFFSSSFSHMPILLDSRVMLIFIAAVVVIIFI